MGKYDQYRQQNNQSNFKYADVVEEFKNGKKWFASSVIWQWKEVVGQVYQGIKNIPKEEGLIRKTWGDFEKRATNIDTNNATMPMWDRRTTRNVGQLLGAANDFIGNTFVSWIKTFVPKSLRESAKDVGSLALETKPGQMTKAGAEKAYTQWKAFEKSNPELAKDLWAVGNIANFALNFVWAGQAAKIKPTGLWDDVLSNINRGVRNTAEKVSPTVQRMAGKIPGQVDNLATGTAEVGISAAVWLSREWQQIIKQQPWLYRQARQGIITGEAATDDIVGALSKRMDDISDLWKGYETIRTSTITVPKNDIANIAVSHLDDMKVSKIDLPLGDRTTVQKALDYIAEYPDVLSAQNALSLRRKLDDLINWKSEATGEGKRIIRGLRAKIDEYLGEKLPWLKELDRKYWPEREFIDKVKWTILDRQWNLKDGAISSVANMIGKGKEMRLDRFEKLLPWIGDKVRALKAFEEIQNLAQIKTGSVARQIFSFAVGWIPWFVATNPYVVGYALEKYGFAKQAIKAILSKGKKISEAEAKAVHRAVKNVSKKEVEKIIAWKVGTPLLPAGKSSVATGNTGGKLPPTDLTPNASTWNAVSSQARISPPQTAWLLDSPKSTISETAQQVSTPVVKSPWNKVNTPIIPKSQPKAKLRTNEDALKKAELSKPIKELNKIDDVKSEINKINKQMVDDMVYEDDGLWDIIPWIYNRLEKKYNIKLSVDDRAKLYKYVDDLATDTKSQLEQKWIEVYKSPYDKPTPKPETKLPKKPVWVQILTKEADIKYKWDYERILKVTKEQLESNEIALKKAHNSPQSVKDTITERIGSNKREIKIAEQKLNELKANETKLPKTPQEGKTGEDFKILFKWKLNDLQPADYKRFSTSIESEFWKPAVQKMIDDLWMDKIWEMKQKEVLEYLSKPKSSLPPPQEGKTVDAQQISDKIQNSFVNNPWDKLAKADRLQGKWYSYKEAKTWLTQTWKDIPWRIEIWRNWKWELEILDGRHLLEAYREKWIKIPNDKIKFRDWVTMEDLTKKKSSLPLSQKSEVKYSKPDTPWFNREKPYWLTTEEWDLISKYTNWGYKWKDGIKELDKAIEKIPNSPWITFRWDNLNDFSKFEKWKIVSFDKPLSSSYKSDIADNFKWNTVFTIDGITGKDIDMLSDVSGEWEVLFSSKSKFKVKSVYKSKDWITNIELSQIE